MIVFVLMLGNPDIDIGLYVFCMSEDETPDQLITYTKHCITGNVSKVYLYAYYKKDISAVSYTYKV